MVEAPGYHKLVTAFYPEGCTYLQNDSVFGVKKSLVIVCTSVSVVDFFKNKDSTPYSHWSQLLMMRRPENAAFQKGVLSSSCGWRSYY